MPDPSRTPTPLAGLSQSPRPSAHEPGLRPAKTILVVEDDPTYRYLTERILRQAGYRTCWTDATSVAWEWIQEGRIDLLVLDVDELREHPYGPLKLQEGLRFLGALRSTPNGARSALPVVMTTSSLPATAPSWKDACVAAGADAFFEHEFDLKAFVRVVKELLPIV